MKIFEPIYGKPTSPPIIGFKCEATGGCEVSVLKFTNSVEITLEINDFISPVSSSWNKADLEDFIKELTIIKDTLV